MERYQHFFAEQEKQRIRDRSDDCWTTGAYNARAISACFSKSAKYPPEPLKLLAEDQPKPMTDAERFWAWATAFNAARHADEKAKGSDPLIGDTAGGEVLPDSAEVSEPVNDIPET